MSWWKTGSLAEAGVFWAIGPRAGGSAEVWPGGCGSFTWRSRTPLFRLDGGYRILILAVVYYLVLFPIGLILRLRGYDPMQRRFDRSAKSYWTPREQEEGTERYFKQF